MASLKSGKLSFIFEYTGYDDEWVQYQIYFLWDGETLLREEVLKKRDECWGKRSEGAFVANDDQRDRFLPFLKKVLESDQADYWEPLEPDIIVALYPEEYFPFLDPHYKVIFLREEFKDKLEARRQLKKEKGKLPDDIYTFVALIDAYNFRDADAYHGEGLSLQMVVKRHELERFVDELENEYSKFTERFNLQEKN
jgi:hypothetical protein